MNRTQAFVFLTIAAAATHAPAAITLIGTTSIRSDASDKSGLSAASGSSTPADRLGSFGSGIAYTGHSNRFVAVDDRGPNNGGAEWRCRFQTFDIAVRPGAPEPVAVSLVSTTLLSSAAGEPLTGNTGAYDLHDQSKGLRLDPEGIRVSQQGTLFISDEYGPWIDEFSLSGRQIHRMAPPAKFLVTTPDGEPANELPPTCTRGRQPNHGFEGLAISPDGARLYAILQRPLIQDGALSANGKRSGHNCRILEVTLATAATRELVYPLESPSHGVSEILAINSHEFLVLERDSEAAKFRKLFKIDVDGCKDVSTTEVLPAEPLAAGAARKSVFLDFSDPKFGLAGLQMPEKIEGLAWGSDLADGRHVLIVTSDNDLKPDQPSWFWVFTVDPADLPGFAAQEFEQRAAEAK